MKPTEHYRMYVEVFGIDVPLIQSQPTESTQVMHRTPSAPRQEQKARENVALVDKHLASVEIEKMVEGQENVVDDNSIPRNDEYNIPNTRLEPKSDKESPEVGITDVIVPVNVYDEEEEEDEINDEDNELEQGPSTLGNQEHVVDYDFWIDSYALDDDEIPTNQVSQDIIEEVSMTIDEAKLKKIDDEMLRQRSPSLSLINQDLLYLKKGNSRPEKIVLSLYKFPAVIFNDDDIKERTSRWDLTEDEVEYGYNQRDLTEDEVEYLKLFEEIEDRLKYRRQMRRLENTRVHTRLEFNGRFFKAWTTYLYFLTLCARVGEYEGTYKDLLRFCIKTIWNKCLYRQQNTWVPIYGERSDLLISEVGNHVGAAGLRVVVAMLSAVKEASDMTAAREVGEYQGAYKDLLRFCIKTIWNKCLYRQQNTWVPIYGEKSDLLISEVGNHVGAAGLRVVAAMLSDVKEAFDMIAVS
nr:hypothetical protein [Tanacetum cinerariifolium]